MKQSIDLMILFLYSMGNPYTFKGFAMSLSQVAARQRLKTKFNGDKDAYHKKEPKNFAQYQKKLESDRKGCAAYRQK